MIVKRDSLLEPMPDLIAKVMMLWRHGEDTCDIAKRLRIAESWAWRALVRGRETLRTGEIVNEL